MKKASKQSALQLSRVFGGLKLASRTLRESRDTGQSDDADFNEVVQGDVAQSQLELLDLKFRRIQLRHKIEELKSELQSR